MPQLNRIIIIVLAAVITIPIILKSRPDRKKPVPAAFFITSEPKGYYQIKGDVRWPGTYPITANMVTVDAIQLAVPMEPPKQYLGPDKVQAALENGARIVMSSVSKGVYKVSVEEIPASQKMVLGIPLDINTITAEDLDRVPGIGPVLAQRIIQYRQTNGGILSLEELVLVEGIGEKKYNQLVKYFN